MIRDVAPALALYVAIRLVALLVLAWMAHRQGYTVLERLRLYDARWLVRLANQGYQPLVPPGEDGHPPMSNIAFLPLYPVIIRIISFVPGLTTVIAGLIVTGVSGLVAAVGLDRFGRRLVGGRAGGLVVVTLWATWPHSVVLEMPYTEALFVALAVWSMLALLDERWVTAGVLCLLAGATRSLGVALSAALIVSAALAVIRALRAGLGVPRRPVVGAVLAPLGFLGYLGYQWARTGRPDAWFWVQSHQWSAGFDGGNYTVHEISKLLTRSEPETPLVLIVCSITVVASLVLFVALAADRAPLPVLLYTGLVTLLSFGTENYLNSRARFLLCAFPLVVPIARALRGSPRRTLVVLLVGVVLVSAWYNAWVLVVWQFSP
jgi:hypothetical protein